MSHDLALSTNTPTAMLELQQAQPLGGGGHYAAFLLVFVTEPTESTVLISTSSL